MPPLHIHFSARPEGVHIDFSELLQKRGTDFNLYLNNWLKQGENLFRESDSELVRALVRRLFAAGTGVYAINVRSYQLCLEISKAVKPEYVYGIINEACVNAGYEVREEPLEAVSTA